MGSNQKKKKNSTLASNPEACTDVKCRFRSDTQIKSHTPESNVSAPEDTFWRRSLGIPSPSLDHPSKVLKKLYGL